MILPPGGTLGVLGGGQLGRMLAAAAAQLGLNVGVFSDEADSPASRVAAWSITAAYDDEAALADFAGRCPIVTFEFENVPAATAQRLQALGAVVRPGPEALATSQDRLLEKQFLQSLEAATAPFAAVDDSASLERALDRVGLPGILKTRRLGYDGKGQIRLHHRGDAPAALAALHGAPAILEGLVHFIREVSLVAARGMDGAMAFYDLSQNEHESGVLRRARSPADSSPATDAQARMIAAALAHRLGYVGVFAIEFFELSDGSLLANEWAPRVHNSGHWTPDACRTGQFEQHVRAVCGWPLGDSARLHDVEMYNLLGEEAQDWAKLAADPAVRLWLYGKREGRAGRKMGHWNRLLGRRAVDADQR